MMNVIKRIFSRSKRSLKEEYKSIPVLDIKIGDHIKASVVSLDGSVKKGVVEAIELNRGFIIIRAFFPDGQKGLPHPLRTNIHTFEKKDKPLLTVLKNL